MILFNVSVTARKLNEYIRHYEPLSYPTEEIHQGHLRAKRSVTRENLVTVKFRAHRREFHIQLKRDLTTFSNNLVIEGFSGRPENIDTSHIYQGYLVGEYTYICPLMLFHIFTSFDSSTMKIYILAIIQHFFQGISMIHY